MSVFGDLSNNFESNEAFHNLTRVMEDAKKLQDAVYEAMKVRQEIGMNQRMRHQEQQKPQLGQPGQEAQPEQAAQPTI